MRVLGLVAQRPLLLHQLHRAARHGLDHLAHVHHPRPTSRPPARPSPAPAVPARPAALRGVQAEDPHSPSSARVRPAPWLGRIFGVFVDQCVELERLIVEGESRPLVESADLSPTRRLVPVQNSTKKIYRHCRRARAYGPAPRLQWTVALPVSQFHPHCSLAPQACPASGSVVWRGNRPGS